MKGFFWRGLVAWFGEGGNLIHGGKEGQKIGTFCFLCEVLCFGILEEKPVTFRSLDDYVEILVRPG